MLCLFFFTFEVHVAIGSIRLSQLFSLVILACFEHACGLRADRLQSAVACHDVFVVHRGWTTKTVVFVFLASLACFVHAHFVSFVLVLRHAIFWKSVAGSDDIFC